LLHSFVTPTFPVGTAKSDFRKLWIRRINAACHENGISYSKFMDGLNKGGIKINRKMLSEMADILFLVLGLLSGSIFYTLGGLFGIIAKNQTSTPATK
jgi:hypothetical protein